MKKLLLLFSVLFFIGIVSAAIPNLGTFTLNESIELKQTCTINGSFCDYCNISSVDYPNGSIAVSDVTMTKRTGDFNYTLLSNYTQDLGVYRVNGFCNFGTDVLKNWAYYFEVTRTGSILSTGESIIYVIFLIAIVLTFGLVSFGAFIVPFRNKRDDDGTLISVNDLKYVKIFLMVISYMLLMIIFGVTRSIMANYLFLNGAFKVFNWLFWFMFSFLWPLIVTSIVFTIIIFITNKQLQKALHRGLPIR